MSELKVLDVSHHNTVTDWKAVARNVDAVIIRCGYRGYGKAGTLAADKKFSAYIEGALKAGIPVGIYYCSTALSDYEAVEEARHCNGLLYKYRDKIQLPVYLDSELMGQGAGRSDKLSREKRTQYGLTFCREIKNHGYKPGLYCSESWYKANLDGAAFDKMGCSIWIARYSTVKPTMRYDGWQYTSTARISGVSGSCDLSHFYTDYTGEDYAELVCKKAGLAENTRAYLDKYTYARDLWRKLWDAMKEE